jgi:DNA-binding NarL/FixJ family response regulator
MSYIIPIRAYVAAWDGRFDEAHRLMATVSGSERFFAHDRAMNTACDALFVLAMGHREAATSMVKAALSDVERTDTTLLYARRQSEIARLLCALVESLAGRHSFAQRMLRKAVADYDTTIAAVREAILCLCRASQEPAFEADVHERLEGLQAVGHGGLARLLGSVFERCGPQSLNASELGMTRAELEILQALATGRRPKDIAHDSGRSVYTVQAHIQNIIRKLGCSGRSEALQVARVRGLIA